MNLHRKLKFFTLFFPVALQPTMSLVLFCIEVSQSHTDTRQDSSGRVINPSQRPLPTQDNTTYKHKRRTSMPSEGFHPAIPATKRLQKLFSLKYTK
jgi:hypothetical protein